MRQPTGPGVLACVLGLVLVLAGCLGVTAPSATPGSTTTTASAQEATDTATATESQGFEPTNESAPLSVELVNERGTWVEMYLRISISGTAETVYTGSHEVAPHSQPWTVYELPRDGRTLDVVVGVGDERGTVTVDTGECSGSVVATLTARGDLRVYATNC